MADAPNPQPLDEILTIEGVERHKRYDCLRYDWCLDIACAGGWSQFHCHDCTAYVPRPKDDLADQHVARVGPQIRRQIARSASQRSLSQVATETKTPEPAEPTEPAESASQREAQSTPKAKSAVVKPDGRVRLRLHVTPSANAQPPPTAPLSQFSANKARNEPTSNSELAAQSSDELGPNGEVKHDEPE